MKFEYEYNLYAYITFVIYAKWTPFLTIKTHTHCIKSKGTKLSTRSTAYSSVYLGVLYADNPSCFWWIKLQFYRGKAILVWCSLCRIRNHTQAHLLHHAEVIFDDWTSWTRDWEDCLSLLGKWIMEFEIERGRKGFNNFFAHIKKKYCTYKIRT